jgi:hypothetical protein
MILQLARWEQVRMMLISGDESCEEFVKRRTIELWKESKKHIDLDCLLSEGIIGFLAHITSLAVWIDLTIQNEWAEIVEEEDLQV